MHECPKCGQACACDIEDVWYDEAPDDCTHRCDPQDLADDDDFDPADEYRPNDETGRNLYGRHDG